MYWFLDPPRVGNGAATSRRRAANSAASRVVGRALSIFVPAITWSRRGLLDVKMTDAVVAAAGETSVEVVLPEG